MSMDEHEKLSMTDDIDRATGNTMRNNEESVRIARAASAPERVPDGEGGWIYQIPNEDGVYPILDCVGTACGEPIPEGRMKLGRIRCIHCQSLKEKR